ncbi:VanZ family protein [Desulfuribacillus alkaliarsenatis]|uniref:VanZ family protein n=1 Tax=Desulfuribacillus alkaliarsenatis TaxID=766136 RepID=A0A1E5G3H0_9FIRM|nr:VanZ family protein [Desulfuribacillus alkaliarsenatis]OEF97638.1 VanZ family protein [Desulfuribacillus alkaliarsenatis]
MNKSSKYISWACVLFWMALIFYLSHQPATESNELSTGITELIKQFIERVMPHIAIDISTLNFIIRKGAHFFAYLVLGVLVINALWASGFKGWRMAGVAFVICVSYAITDEVHQLFIPGRSGEIRDVIIDSAGALVGISIYYLLRSAYGINKT